MALYTLAPQPWLILLDDSGALIPAGQLAIYAAGTSTPATAYTSAAGTAHPFPITLNGSGQVPGGLYLEPGRSYKFVLHAPQIEDPLDGAILRTQDNIAAVPRATVSILTLSTPGTFASVNVAGVDIIEYTGAGDLHLKGMTGGVLGQSILIRNLTGNTIWLYHADAAAPPGATMGNLVTVGPTPLAGPRSSAQYTYASSQVWRLDTSEMGQPLTPPFSAANYLTQTGGATWTVDAGDIALEEFYLQGRRLTFSFRYNGTSLNVAASLLAVRLPFGWTATSIQFSSGITALYPGAAGFVAATALMASSALVAFQLYPITTNWPVSTNQTSVLGQLSITLS